MESGSLFTFQRKKQKKTTNPIVKKYLRTHLSNEKKKDLSIGQLPTLNKTCSTSFDTETRCRFYRYLFPDVCFVNFNANV